MASVWYAENNVGRPFAIKLLHPDLLNQEATIAERFRTEAQIMVRLNHPNIRRVEDYYEDGQTFAIIMEYLAGEDLHHYVHRQGRVTEETALAWYGQILDAFGYMHQQGYFHRDVKPANLFLTKEGVVKVMDFGISKIVSSNLELTQTNMLMGSPLYMSPEQILTPKAVTFRTDIYSLGVTLYSLLSGSKPYNDTQQSAFSIQTDIVQKPLPWLDLISDTTNGAIAKATRKDPNQRFDSCAVFAVALTEPEIASVGIDKPTLIAYQSKPLVDQFVDQFTELAPRSIENDAAMPIQDAVITPAITRDVNMLERLNLLFIWSLAGSILIDLLRAFTVANSPDREALQKGWGIISDMGSTISWSIGLCSLVYHISLVEGYPRVSVKDWLTNVKAGYPKQSNVHRIIYRLIFLSITSTLFSFFTDTVTWGFAIAELILDFRLYFVLRKATNYAGLIETFSFLNLSLIWFLIIGWGLLSAVFAVLKTEYNGALDGIIIGTLNSLILSTVLIVMNNKALQLYRTGKPLPVPESIPEPVIVRA